jgi:hypothetical protein
MHYTSSGSAHMGSKTLRVPERYDQAQPGIDGCRLTHWQLVADMTGCRWYWVYRRSVVDYLSPTADAAYGTRRAQISSCFRASAARAFFSTGNGYQVGMRFATAAARAYAIVPLHQSGTAPFNSLLCFEPSGRKDPHTRK